VRQEQGNDVNKADGAIRSSALAFEMRPKRCSSAGFCKVPSMHEPTSLWWDRMQPNLWRMLLLHGTRLQLQLLCGQQKGNGCEQLGT